MLTQSMTPNQISAASGPTTGARIFCAVGAIIGRMMKAISKKSRKNARKKMKMLMKIRKPQTPPGSEVRWCSSQTPPETPRHTTEKQVEQVGNAHGLEAEPDHRDIDHREGELEPEILAEHDGDDRADAGGDDTD